MINDYKDEGLNMIVLSSFNKCLKTICDKSVFTTQIIWVNGNFFFDFGIVQCCGGPIFFEKRST